MVNCHLPWGSTAVSWPILVWFCAIASWLARVFCCLRLIAEAGGYKAIHSGAASSPVHRLIENGGSTVFLRYGCWTARPFRWFAAILLGSVGVQVRELSKAYQTRAVLLLGAYVGRKSGRWTPCHYRSKWCGYGLDMQVPGHVESAGHWCLSCCDKWQWRPSGWHCRSPQRDILATSYTTSPKSWLTLGFPISKKSESVCALIMEE